MIWEGLGISGWVGGFESKSRPDLGPRGKEASELNGSGSGMLPDFSGPPPDSEFGVWVMSSHERVSGSESSAIRTQFVLKIEGEFV